MPDCQCRNVNLLSWRGLSLVCIRMNTPRRCLTVASEEGERLGEWQSMMCVGMQSRIWSRRTVRPSSWELIIGTHEIHVLVRDWVSYVFSYIHFAVSKYVCTVYDEIESLGCHEYCNDVCGHAGRPSMYVQFTIKSNICAESLVENVNGELYHQANHTLRGNGSSLIVNYIHHRD